MSRVPLAWRNLTHRPKRLLVVLGGINFAVLLMFMQLGFWNALFDSTVQILEKLRADLVLVAKAQYALPAGQSFDLRRVIQARGVEGVRTAEPVYIEFFQAYWQQPDPPAGRPRPALPIRVIAVEPDDALLDIPELAVYGEAIQREGTALVDRRSKAEYGIPASDEAIRRMEGLTLSGREVRLLGSFALGTDFAYDANLLVSTRSLEHYFPYRGQGRPRSAVDLGVVRLHPGADVRTVQQSLQARLPDDVLVLTKGEAIAREKDFWRTSTPIGTVFFTGTVIGFIVGVIICYQVIYTDIADHLAEFATLKAMGYSGAFFIRFVLAEAFYLSVLAFLPGWLISLGLYHLLAKATGLTMMLDGPRTAVVFALTLAMCIVSGCLAMRKLLAADPAELF